MSIPNSKEEMETTPIPEKLLNLLDAGSSMDKKLNEWLSVRCFFGVPTKPEALAFIKRHPKDTTRRIPEQVRKAANLEG